MSNNNIVDLNKFDVADISICSPEQITPNGHIFETKLIKNHNLELVIHTPRIAIYEKPKIFLYNNRQYFKLNICFYNYEFCDDTKKFVNKLVEIENIIKLQSKTLWKNINKISKNKLFIPSIYFNENKTKAYLTLSIQTEIKNNQSIPVVSIYDKYRKLMDLDYIIPNSTAYSIIMFRNVWQKGNKMGLNWVLLQAKIYHPIYKLDECIILDPNEENPKLHYHNLPTISSIPNPPSIPIPPLLKLDLPSEDHPIYGKFLKMRRMKIPDGAIRNKCMIEGVDYDAFISYATSSISNSNLPIPPPINLFGLSSTSNTPNISGGLSKITPNMLSSIKLKKNTNELPTPKKIHIENPTGFKPPSANDLLNILNKLKKINK